MKPLTFLKAFNPNAWVAVLMPVIMGLGACSSTKTIGLSCQERQIEIFVDDEYLGRDIVYYTAPKGKQYIEISCRENGLEVYRRKLNIDENKGRLIELQIPKNYRYNSKPF